MEKKVKLTGGCRCGGVRYEIGGRLVIEHCHCEVCRRAHGAAYASCAVGTRENFRWLAGEVQVTRYVNPEGNVERCFCRVCGSGVVNHWLPDPEHVEVTLGTLDEDPGPLPTRHKGEKAAWVRRAEETFPSEP